MRIDKRSGDAQNSFNQTGGIDTRLVFFKDWFVDAHMAGTQSAGNPSGASDVGASLSYRSNWLDAKVERRKIGPTSTRKWVLFRGRIRTKRMRMQLSKLGPRSAASGSCNSRGSSSTLLTHTMSCKLRSGKVRFAPNLIMAATQIMTSRTFLRSESQRLFTSIRMCPFQTACSR